MNLFQQKTQISSFTSCEAFFNAFHPTKEDLIFASSTIYQKYFAVFHTQADILFHSDYGKGEPTDQMIDAMLNTIRMKSYRRIFAIGGGSVIDCAKLFTLQGNASTEDMFLQKVPLIKDKELIAVPTTCGSGSEVSKISITELTSMKTKMGLAVDALYPNHAVLIPQLLETLPYPFFITSSVDALIHASESFVSPKSNPHTECFSKEAIHLILKGFQTIAEKGPDARFSLLNDFMYASNFAGIAFGNTGTGAVHALSYPLSGVYHVTHGEANYQMFLEVFKTYLRLDPQSRIKDIMQLYADTLGCCSDTVFDYMEHIMNQLLQKKRLSAYGMKKEEITAFSDSVIASQQRLLSNSCVPLSKSVIIDIYTALF